jgi:hypothetical protein
MSGTGARYGIDVATAPILPEPVRRVRAPAARGVGAQAAWIPAPEAARRLGVSRRTFGRMLARGDVPYSKRGSHQQSRVVVHTTALARLLDPSNAT